MNNLNLIKFRDKIKEQMKKLDPFSEEYKRLEALSYAIKIMVNTDANLQFEKSKPYKGTVVSKDIELLNLTEIYPRILLEINKTHMEEQAYG